MSITGHRVEPDLFHTNPDVAQYPVESLSGQEVPSGHEGGVQPDFLPHSQPDAQVGRDHSTESFLHQASLYRQLCNVRLAQSYSVSWPFVVR